MSKLSREQSLSLVKWVHKHHPQSADVVAREGHDLAELDFVVRGDECVEWGAGKSGGYGVINIRLVGGGRRMIRAHRALRQAVDGLQDLDALHRCGNKACISLDHTYWGTQSDNTLDMYRLSETRNVGETSHLAKLTQAQVDDIRARYVKGNRWHPGNSAELMAEYGISAPTLSMITTGRTWRRS